MRKCKAIFVALVLAAAVSVAAAQPGRGPRPVAFSPQGGGGRHGAGPGFGRGEHAGHHAGEWLRKYKDLPPAEQEKALASDPEFQKLPPERQQRLRERLQKFNQLPPEQQQKILDRMATWEHFTPEQRQQARALFQRMHNLPEDRRHMLVTAYRHLRDMDPEQQQRVLDSAQFKSMFSDDERDILRGFVGLGVGPGEHGPGPGGPGGPGGEEPKFDEGGPPPQTPSQAPPQTSR